MSEDERALRFAGRLERLCSRVLGEAVAGVILHGSLTLGDYIPGRSDIDVLAIVEEPLTKSARAALEAEMGGRAVARAGRVDLRVVTRAVALRPTLAPPMELYIAVPPGPGDGLESGGEDQGERDLVVELSVCRAHGLSLAGPEPPEVIGDVPDEWVLLVGDAQLADWQKLDFEPRYADLMVFTACRLWRFGEERRHCSKSAAGDWVLARDPTLEVVRAALRRRRGDPSVAIEEEPVRQLLSLVRARVAVFTQT